MNFKNKRFLFLVVLITFFGATLILFDFFVVTPFSKREIKSQIQEDLKRKSDFIKSILSEKNIENVQYACRHLLALFEDGQLPVNVITFGDNACSKPTTFVPNLSNIENGFRDFSYVDDQTQPQKKSIYLVYVDSINSYRWMIGKNKPVEISFFDYLNFSFTRQMLVIFSLIKFIFIILIFFSLFYYAFLRRMHREFGYKINSNKYFFLDRILSVFELDTFGLISNLFNTLTKINEIDFKSRENSTLYLENYFLSEYAKAKIKSNFNEVVTVVSIDINNSTKFSEHSGVTHEMELKLQIHGDEFLSRLNGKKQKSRGDDIPAVFIGDNHFERALAFCNHVIESYSKEVFYINGSPITGSLKAGIHTGQLEITIDKNNVLIKSNPFPVLNRLMGYYNEDRHGSEKDSIKRNSILMFNDEVTPLAEKMIANSVSDRFYLDILKNEKSIRRIIWLNKVWYLINDNPEFLSFYCQNSDLIFLIQTIKESNKKKLNVSILKSLTSISIIHAPQSVLDAIENSIIYYLNMKGMSSNENLIILTMLIDLMPKFKGVNDISGLVVLLDKIDLKKDNRLTANLLRLYRKLEMFEVLKSKLLLVEASDSLISSRILCEKLIFEAIVQNSPKVWGEILDFYISKVKQDFNVFIYIILELTDFYKSKGQYQALLVNPKYLESLGYIKNIDVHMIPIHLQDRLKLLHNA